MSPSCWVEVARISPQEAEAVALSIGDRLEPSICLSAAVARSIVAWSCFVSACSAAMRAFSWLRLASG